MGCVYACMRNTKWTQQDIYVYLFTHYTLTHALCVFVAIIIKEKGP